MSAKPPVQEPLVNQESLVNQGSMVNQGSVTNQGSVVNQEPSINGEDLARLLTALERVVPTSGTGLLLSEPQALIRLIDQAVKVAPKRDDLAALIGQQLQARNLQLAPALKVRLLFWQTLFTTLEELCQWDMALKLELQRLRPLFLQAGLADENFAVDLQHPIRRFFDRLLTDGSYWYANSGKENTQFYDAFVQAVDDLAAVDGADSGRIYTAIDKFVALLDKQHARAQLMTQRCAESELGMAKIYRAQAQVVLLLDSLVGCALPESILQFLRSTLKSELQFILINHGETAIPWQSWSAIIKRLPQVFPALIPDAEKPVEPEPPNLQQLYRDVQIIVGLLDEHVTVSAANQQVYDDGVADLRERLFGRLRGTHEVLACFEPLATLDELSQIGAAVSPALLKRVAHLRVGDWFMFFNSDNQWLRCKLLLCPPQTEQLLFVNRSGHRVLQKSVRDFSACLATHIAKPLITTDIFSLALSRTYKKLQSLYEKNKSNKVASGNNVALEHVVAEVTEKHDPAVKRDAADALLVLPVAQGLDENEQRDSDEITGFLLSPAPDVVGDTRGLDINAINPPSAPASDRKSAAEKALQEARVLERLAVRRERQGIKPEATISTETFSAEESESTRAQVAVDLLNIGAWLDLPVANKELPQRCKLVAIMRSTKMFIFVDRHGVKVAELQRDKLINLLAERRAQIVSRGDNFEGQLSKVVLTLRRDL